MNNIQELIEDRDALQEFVRDYERLKAAESIKGTNTTAAGDVETRCAYLEGTVNSSKNPLVVFDPDEKICFYNLAFKHSLDSLGAVIEIGATYDELLDAKAAANEFFKGESTPLNESA